MTPFIQAPALAADIRSENTGQDPIAIGMLQDSLGDEGAREILRMFISFASEIIVELQDAIRTRKAADARRSLSELSNSCSVTGASALLKGCIVLEQELSQPDWDRVEHCMNALIREMRCVGQFINELLSQASAEDVSS